MGPGPDGASGAALVVIGICGFAVSGLVDFIRPNGRRLIVLPVSPLIDVLALLGGFALVRLAVKSMGSDSIDFRSGPGR